MVVGWYNTCLYPCSICLNACAASKGVIGISPQSICHRQYYARQTHRYWCLGSLQSPTPPHTDQHPTQNYNSVPSSPARIPRGYPVARSAHRVGRMSKCRRGSLGGRCPVARVGVRHSVFMLQQGHGTYLIMLRGKTALPFEVREGNWLREGEVDVEVCRESISQFSLTYLT